MSRWDGGGRREGALISCGFRIKAVSRLTGTASGFTLFHPHVC